MYLERDKTFSSLVLLVLWEKWVVFPPLWLTLVLWVWGLHCHLIVTTFGWIMVIYLLLGPSVLMVGTFGMLTFILWFLFLDHCYPILSQLNLMFLFFKPLVKLILWFYFVRPLDHFILWFLFYHWTFGTYPKSTYFWFYVLLIFTLKARVQEGPF